MKSSGKSRRSQLRPLRCAPVARLEGQRNEIGDGPGEVLLLESPLSTGADMFVADHPDDLAAQSDSGVQHRTHLVRCVVTINHAGGSGIVGNFRYGKCARCFKGDKIGLVVLYLPHRTAGVFAIRQGELVDALDGATVMRVQPDTDPLGVRALCRELGNLAGRRLYFSRNDASIGRQLNNGRLLPFGAPVAFQLLVFHTFAFTDVLGDADDPRLGRSILAHKRHRERYGNDRAVTPFVVRLQSVNDARSLRDGCEALL